MDSLYIFINNEEKEFKQYKDNPTYYVSADGDVYSTFSKKNFLSIILILMDIIVSMFI